MKNFAWLFMPIISMVFTPTKIGSANTIEDVNAVYVMGIESKLAEVTCELEATRDSLLITKELLAKTKIIKKIKASTTKRSKRIERLAAGKEKFISTYNIMLSKGDRVKPYLDSSLHAALKAYTGPPVSITSMFRPHAGRSLHAKGRAVDIRWDNNAKAMLLWSESEDGKQWIEQYGVQLYCENISRKDRLDFGSRYRYISWATGPHIHLQVK